jgi:predicted component of type VI protein secretion system
MALELKIVSEHADLVGDDALREFADSGGTIGRSLHNDWILPDPDRYISGRHATIDFRGGIYYLLDTSSNGVYVNNEAQPIGKGNPRRLFDGDRLRMGDFKFEVSIDSGESLIMPMDPRPTVVPDNIEQLVDEVSLRTGMKLLDEEEITGDDEFQSALFGSGPKPTVPDINFDAVPTLAANATPPRKATRKTEKTGKNSGLAVTAEDLFDSFLDGLEISRADLHPSVSRPDMMLAAGQVLRESIAGMTDLLTSRANLKTSFRLDQTSVLPRHNNPIKLAQNTNDLIKQLLVGGTGDYLGARDAIREVCSDLIHHQDALLDAMNVAFIDFADRFDPQELQEGFENAIDGSKLFGFLNSRKFWQMYCDLYPILTEKGSGRFPQMFGEEFVTAYEKQVSEYRRHDRESMTAHAEDEQGETNHLMVTQRLQPPVASEASSPVVETYDTVDDVAGANTTQIDQSFLDELENSLNDEIKQDQLKA